jgi:hypothetical protein
MKNNSQRINVLIASVAAVGLLVSLSPTIFAAEPTTTPQIGNTNRPARIPVRPRPDVRYQHGPDSQRKAGVPRGKITDYDWKDSKVFPGTIRHYSIYVPLQYDPDKPAALMVFQDGHTYLKDHGDFRVPIVFDNLIHSKEMPVTIGVFATHGRVKALNDQALDRFNRSYEYDGLGDNYVRFLLDELLPEVEKKTTTDGRPIRLPVRDTCSAARLGRPPGSGRRRLSNPATTESRDSRRAPCSPSPPARTRGSAKTTGAFSDSPRRPSFCCETAPSSAPKWRSG